MEFPPEDYYGKVTLIEKATESFAFVFYSNEKKDIMWNNMPIDDEDLIILQWDKNTQKWETIFLHNDEEIINLIEQNDVLQTLKEMFNTLRHELKLNIFYKTIPSINKKDAKELKKIKSSFNNNRNK